MRLHEWTDGSCAAESDEASIELLVQKRRQDVQGGRARPGVPLDTICTTSPELLLKADVSSTCQYSSSAEQLRTASPRQVPTSGASSPRFISLEASWPPAVLWATACLRC